MSKFYIIAVITTLLAGLLLNACASTPPAFKGTTIDPPLPTADFTLTDQNGQPFRLSDQQSDLTLLFFGYASCPDVCPMTLAVWNQIYEALGDDADRVRFILVTVDPDRDTPAQMKPYIAVFNPSFIGRTGTLDELETVYERYGIFREKDTESETAAGRGMG